MHNRWKKLHFFMDSYQAELNRIRSILADSPRGMTITELSKELDVNRNSVAKYLDVLLISGHVEMRSLGPAKLFFLSQRVPLSALLDISSSGAVMLDSRLKIVQANDSFLSIVGLEREDLVGSRLSEYRSTDSPLEDLDSIAKEALSGSEVDTELTFSLDGRQLFLRVKALPTAFEDGSQGVTILVDDITGERVAEEALRESERRYRTLFERAQDAIIVETEDASISDANQAALRMFGYSKKEILSADMQGLCKDAVENMRNRHDDITDKENTLSKETQMIRKDGTRFPAEVSIAPLEEGETKLWMWVIRDITARKRAEDEERRQAAFESLIISTARAFVGLSDDEVDSAVEQTLERIAFFSEVDCSRIFLFSKRASKIENTHVWCVDGVERNKGKQQNISPSVLPWSVEQLQAGKNVVVPRVDKLKRKAAKDRRKLKESGIKSILMMPLLSNGTAIGFTAMEAFETETNWSEELILLLGMVNDIIALAISRKLG